jgi:NADH dehydrogenase
VFVIGELAKVVENGVEVPGVAQPALQGGRHVAPRRCSRRNTLHSTVCSSGFVWWVVHIYMLIGFRNRVLVMLSWAWSWVTFRRGGAPDHR